MNEYQLTAAELAAYERYLIGEERSTGTIQKYLRDTQEFLRWLDGRDVTKELAAQWRTHLLAEGYAPVTVNAMLSALNGLFRFLKWEEMKVRFLKIQRKTFREPGRELSREEYKLLLSGARKLGRERLALLMETICATGIRVSEVQYITVEAARTGRTEISLKGKVRTILLPGKLCGKLLKYAKKQNTVSGEIFLTGNGKSLSRRQIWAEMKGICKESGVEESKVFPHNLRHLFAVAFYRSYKDISRLADLLGHSSIETTRIYLMTSGKEHVKQLEGLGLVS